MAKRVIEELVDDLDGTPATQTVRIGWGTEWRELDLSEKNLATLAKGFDRFWDVARPIKNGSRPARPARRRKNAHSGNGSNRDYDREQFKTWAVENDIKLNRGRPPRELVERFWASQR